MITPEDDLTHPIGDEPDFNESMYVHFHDPVVRLGGFLRLANRPNEGRGERTICIYLPDGRVAFGFARPAVSGNDAMVGAGLSFAICQPMKHLEAAFDGTVSLLDRPADLAAPGPALAAAPTVPCQIRLDVTALAAPHEQTFESDGASFAPNHYEQLLAARGSVAIGGETYPIDGFGLRDHSWGPRSWQAPWFYRWLHGSSAGLGFMAAWFEDADGSRRVGGFLWDGTGVLPVRDVSVQTTRDDLDHQAAIDLTFLTDREWRFRGVVEAAVPLRHRGESGTTRIVEGSMAWTGPNGVSLHGMSEYFDRVIGGKPVGSSV